MRNLGARIGLGIQTAEIRSTNKQRQLLALFLVVLRFPIPSQLLLLLKVRLVGDSLQQPQVLLPRLHRLFQRDGTGEWPLLGPKSDAEAGA